MTEPLSPAAQQVMDAFLGDCENTGLQMDDLRENVAAALRAAADQVVPETNGPRSELEYELGVWDARDDVRAEILAIAAELEGAE